MPQLLAPDFLRKLNLLIDYAGFKNLTHIAAEMDVNESTMRSWTKQRGYIHEGTVSKHGREPVIRFFCAHLPNVSEQSVIDLLEGPYDDMAAAFFEAFRTSLNDFIDAKAKFDGVKLHVELDDASPTAQKLQDFIDMRQKQARRLRKMIATIKVAGQIYPSVTVPMGVEFRLEFQPFHRAKYCLCLQQSPQGWGAFQTTPASNGQMVHLPDRQENGESATLSEEHDIGASRFTLIQSTQPFPDFIHINLRDGVPLSRTDIGFLTRYLQNVPEADNTLHAIDIEFVRLD